MTYKVCIPTGRWMGGVQTFKTVKAAYSFMDRWNQVEVNCGHSSLTFYRDGRSFVPVSGPLSMRNPVPADFKERMILDLDQREV